MGRLLHSKMTCTDTVFDNLSRESKTNIKSKNLLPIRFKNLLPVRIPDWSKSLLPVRHGLVTITSPTQLHCREAALILEESGQLCFRHSDVWRH